jgi:hypothetical protein
MIPVLLRLKPLVNQPKLYSTALVAHLPQFHDIVLIRTIRGDEAGSLPV